MEQRTFEGTWEEILLLASELSASELSGQRVRLTVLPTENSNPQSNVNLDQLLKGKVGRVQFQPPDLSTRTKAAFGDLLANKYKQLGLDQ